MGKALVSGKDPDFFLAKEGRKADYDQYLAEAGRLVKAATT